MTTIISVNGSLLASPLPPALSPLDRGVTLGDGLFETMRFERGVVWYKERHLDRLVRAAHRVGIPYPSELPAWIDAVTMACTTHETHESSQHAPPQASVNAIRITLTRGVAHAAGLAGDDSAPPTTIISCSPAILPPLSAYDTGISLHRSTATRNERAISVGLKSTNYLDAILALREARAAGYDDALLLDTRGNVSEASASNIFAWTGETLITPSMQCGILPGITRAIVLELAAVHAIPVTEGEYPFDTFAHARELFCTSALRGVISVTRLEGNTVGTGSPGPVTRSIMTAYAAHTPRC